MRILLIRHGRTAHLHAGGLLDREGVLRWRTAYDAAGIATDDHPPPDVLAAVARADVLASSDLPRAEASAARLTASGRVRTSPLLREIPLPVPAMGPLRAPLAVWGVLITLAWGVDIIRGRDAGDDAIEQARLAAVWCRGVLVDVDKPDATIAVVTHGVFLRLLARQLVIAGWEHESTRRSYANWSVWPLRSR